MKVTVILLIIDVLGTILKGLVKRLDELEIEGRTDTVQTIALLKSARILRRVLEISGDLLSHKFQ